MTPEDEQRQLDSARRALVHEFEGRIPAPEVEQRFAELAAEFDGAPVRGFVPVLVQRRVRERLRASSSA